jgi:hypothetical protein
MIEVWIIGVLVSLAILLPRYALRDWHVTDVSGCVVASLIWPIFAVMVIYSYFVDVRRGGR